MELQVLGCSGGVGRGVRTTSFRLGEAVLLDAGSGVGDLTLEQMARIGHVFLTHAHLDHVAFLPFLLDSVFDRLAGPITVHARAETCRALADHLFNGVLWPDFTRLPHPEAPVVRLRPMAPGEVRDAGGWRVEMLPVRHAVPAAGFRLSAGGQTLAFSGDCTSNDVFWEALNAGERLDHLLVEAAFPNGQETLAAQAGHYTPALLGRDLAKLAHDPAVWISHAMPEAEERILAQCREAMPGRTIRLLTRGMQLPG